MTHQQTPSHGLTFPSLQQRVEQIAWPIKCHWAKHIPIVIVDNARVGEAAIDFTKVYISPALGRFGDDGIFTVLAHEWAHRMVSPKSFATAHIIDQAIADELNVSLELAHALTEPAIELIVDRANCEIETWEDRYKRGFFSTYSSLVHQWARKCRQRDKHMDDDGTRLQGLIMTLRMINVNRDEVPSDLFPWIADAEKLLAKLFNGWCGYLDDEDPDHLQRIMEFAKAFLSWVPDHLQGQPLAMLELLQEMSKQLLQLLLLAKDSESASTSGNAAMHTDTNPDDNDHTLFNINLTRQVTDHLMTKTSKSRQITGLWRLGEPLTKLDLKRSFRTSPTMIAGLTTRKKMDGARQRREVGGKQLKICMIVDDSGSMSGDEACLTRSLCEGINRFAAQRQIPVGLLTFGGEVNSNLPPQRRYDHITKELKLLNGNLGGTNLRPALQRFAQWMENDRDIRHAMLLTDAECSDWDDAKKLLSKILEQTHLTILMINSEIPDILCTALARQQNQLSFFKVDPSAPLNFAILEEIIP